MKRIDIFLGKNCNNNCIFCISKDKENADELSFDQVKKILVNSFDKGARDAHFTGSEPTIREDIVHLIDYAKKTGYQRIRLTTNGRMLAYPDLCNKLVKAGLNGIIFSIHGHNSELHDSLTQCPSSFQQLMKGLSNIREYNHVTVESSTVIVKQNYKHLEQIARLLVSLDLNHSELIFVHPKGLAKKNYNKIVPKLTDIEKYLQKAIKIGIDNNKEIVSLYVPFCFLGKYVMYASELYESEEVEQTGSYFHNVNTIEDRKSRNMKKSTVCKECKYDLICNGVHNEHLDDEQFFKPVKGKKILSKTELRK